MKLCMLSADLKITQNTLIEFIQVCHQSGKHFGSISDLTFSSTQIWVKIVCKQYQLMTSVGRYLLFSPWITVYTSQKYYAVLVIVFVCACVRVHACVCCHKRYLIVILYVMRPTVKQIKHYIKYPLLSSGAT